MERCTRAANGADIRTNSHEHPDSRSETAGGDHNCAEEILLCGSSLRTGLSIEWIPTSSSDYLVEERLNAARDIRATRIRPTDAVT